jgi:hypothetical protein
MIESLAGAALLVAASIASAAIVTPSHTYESNGNAADQNGGPSA